jgi:hypothetical protein
VIALHGLVGIVRIARKARLTPEAGIVEAGVVVGDGEQRNTRRPAHRALQHLAVVHCRLVQELYGETTPHLI